VHLKVVSNACAERVIGTLRRELFDHVIVLNERHLKSLMSSYLDYYHPWRTRQSLDSDAPDGRPVRAAEPCDLWNSQPFTAFIMSIFRRLHEYSGPTAVVGRLAPAVCVEIGPGPARFQAC